MNTPMLHVKEHSINKVKLFIIQTSFDNLKWSLLNILCKFVFLSKHFVDNVNILFYNIKTRSAANIGYNYVSMIY